MTLPELCALSGFQLPKRDPLDLPGWAALRRGEVPAVSRDFVRQLDRAGCFDIPKLAVRDRRRDFAIVVWQRPRVRQGEPRLYSGHDLLTVQIAAWMSREGYALRYIVAALRGSNAIRHLLFHLRAIYQRPDVELSYGAGIWNVFNESDVQDYIASCRAAQLPDPFAVRLPLPWLECLRTNFARLRALRAEARTVVIRRRRVRVDDLQRAQAETVRPVATEIAPRGTGKGSDHG